MNTSYSAIDTFLTCPLKYKYQAIDRIKTPKSKEQFFGTLLHHTLKLVHTPGILSPTLEQALDFYSKNWNAEVFSDETEERAAFAQGVAMLQDYYKKNDPAKANIVDLESRFQVEIGQDPVKSEKSDHGASSDTHIVSGIADRIDKNEHGVKLTSERNREQIKQSEQLIVDLIGEIEKSSFEPRISGLCDWCGYQNICPMWKHKFKKKGNEEIDAQKLIDEYINLKDEIKSKSDRIGKLKEILSDYMDQEKVDQVFSDAGRILRTIRKTYKYDEKKLREILEPLDKWEDVLKIDGVALRNILGVLPYQVRKEAEKARAIDKESKTFVVKKGKDIKK